MNQRGRARRNLEKTFFKDKKKKLLYLVKLFNDKYYYNSKICGNRQVHYIYLCTALP